MKNIYKIVFTLALCGSAVSCKQEFLEQQPIGAYADASLSTPAGVRSLLVGAYALLNGGGGMVTEPMQQLFGSIRGGESHKGSTSGDQPQMLEIQRYEVGTGNSSAQSHFSFFFNAAFRCNQTLDFLSKVSTGMSDAERTQIKAEARFLRGHYYFMLKRLFGNVPYIDETVADARVPNADASGNYVDIWPQIAADFDFARKNLPATQSEAGRPNKWAAEAYYGKVLLYQGKFAEALPVITNVINNGVTDQNVKYALLPNYHDNFNAAKENHAEWVWGVQHAINDGSTNGTANGNQGIQYTGAQPGTGPCLCSGFGFFNPTQWFVNHFRVDANGLPIFDDAARNASGVKSDDGVATGSAFTPDAGLLDPRLDWSVGRRGIPYLDFGDFNPAWVRSVADASPYLSQKQFTYKSQSGTFSTGSTNALNIPIIRFADVLLMGAELEARAGSLENARGYVNQVRNRMANNTASKDNWVKKADGVTNAANYKVGLYPLGSAAFATKPAALEAILFERTLELGLEGHRGYDVIRFGNADGGATDVKELNNYIKFEGGLRAYLQGALYSRSKDELMPIPQTAVNNSFKDGAPTLKQNPNY